MICGDGNVGDWRYQTRSMRVDANYNSSRRQIISCASSTTFNSHGRINTEEKQNEKIGQTNNLAATRL